MTNASTRKITKVRHKVNDKSGGPLSRWEEVRLDLEAEISRLQKLVEIVEEKIERGEPWPGEERNHDASNQSVRE